MSIWCYTMLSQATETENLVSYHGNNCNISFYKTTTERFTININEAPSKEVVKKVSMVVLVVIAAIMPAI